MTPSRKLRLWPTVSVLAGILLVAVIAMRLAIPAWLTGESFRLRLSQTVSEILKADGSFLPLHLVNGAFFSDGFAAQGSHAAFFSTLKADEIRAAINWRALLHRKV